MPWAPSLPLAPGTHVPSPRVISPPCYLPIPLERGEWLPGLQTKHRPTGPLPGSLTMSPARRRPLLWEKAEAGDSPRPAPSAGDTVLVTQCWAGHADTPALSTPGRRTGWWWHFPWAMDEKEVGNR